MRKHGVLLALSVALLSAAASSGIVAEDSARKPDVSKSVDAVSKASTAWTTDPSLPIGAYRLSRGTDDYIYFNAPDGQTYSLGLGAVQPGIWAVAKDNAQKPVIAYYRSTVGNISLLVASLDGANARAATALAVKLAADCAATYGMLDAADPRNPLRRPAFIYRLANVCQGQRDPLMLGEAIEVLAVDVDKYASAGSLKVAKNITAGGDLIVNGNQHGPLSSFIETGERGANNRTRVAQCPAGQFVVGLRLVDHDGGKYCVTCVSAAEIVCGGL